MIGFSTLKVEKFVCTNFHDRNFRKNFPEFEKKFAKFAKICFREIFWKAVFREIRENKFSRNLKNRSYAKFAKLFSHKNFNAWKSSILRYLPKLILGQNWAQNIMISLEYHHFELNIIERNPQDGGSLMICALWWCYGMVGWSKTNVPPPSRGVRKCLFWQMLFATIFSEPVFTAEYENRGEIG